jgi:hypothetical protein
MQRQTTARYSPPENWFSDDVIPAVGYPRQLMHLFGYVRTRCFRNFRIWKQNETGKIRDILGQ